MNRKPKPKTHYSRPRPKSHGPKGAKYLKPKPQTFVGLYHANPNGYGFVSVPNSPEDFFIPRGAEAGAEDRDLVRIEVPNPTRTKARVVSVERANDGTLESAQAAILYHYDVSPAFPPQVDAAAAAVPQAVSPEECAGRADFRDICVVTIDSASAKDLDDAVSLTADDRGRRVLGVHIAHVSHYVAPGSPLDEEALRRGTSVYYVNQVAPMLPTALSNGICSLNPRENRLTLSCLMTLDDSGEVIDYQIVPGVISTTARLSYAEVNCWLDGQLPSDGPLSGQGEAAKAMRALVCGLDHLAAQRRKARRLRGALELTSTECYFTLDAGGNVTDVSRRAAGKGESLIEECMLLANETVARHLCENGLPGVFRVHEKPSADKTEALRRQVAPLGFALKDGDGFHLQKLIEAFRGTPREGAVNMMVLRSLMKAQYDPKNLGHFGLAAPYYCHFTSPIRRYPDLVVHRILTAAFSHPSPAPASAKTIRKLASFTPQAALQSSQREVAAVNAEREIEKLYMAQWMSAHLGEPFASVVSGLTRFGVFVSLDNGVEGMLPVEALPGGPYALNEDTLVLSGAHGGLTLAFGDPLTVAAVSADPSTGRIDFALA